MTAAYNGAPPVAKLISHDGVTWLDYRKTLVADYARAWRDVGFCYVMLFGGFALHVAANVRWGNVVGLVTAPYAAAWVGFWLHALNQFAHEGAHGNLARDRRRNDLLADWLLWPLFAMTVRSYRRSHMQHHKHLGGHLDTEINYHECMNPWFVFKSVTGIQLAIMVGRYILKPKTAPAGGSESGRAGTPPASQRETLVAVARTGLIHGLLIAVPAAFGLFGAALAWLLGVMAMYPLFGTTRQVLEHRDYEASCATDFSKVEHGAVNRLFGDDFFSRYFGAAGVNRHLLHHWDPAIPYTRLADMEAFMMSTPFAAQVKESRTTYYRAARAMLRTALRS